MSIARVCIFDLPYHADRLFDYRIPTELEGSVLPGSLVSVPFGRGNRGIPAVVFEITDTTELDSLKPISSVARNGPMIGTEQLRLAAFLKSHTLCSYGEAIKVQVPSAAFSKVTECVRTKGKRILPGSGEALPPKAAAVLGYLEEKGDVPLSKLSGEFGDGIPKTVSYLAKEGYVERFSIVKEPSSVKKTAVISLAVSDEVAKDILTGGGQTGIRLRSPMQISIIKTLLGKKAMDLEDLAAETGCKNVQVLTLEKKGILSREEFETYRDPYAGRAKTEGSDIVLSDEQTEAFGALKELYLSHEPKAALLHGVTGSGKTSVIKKLIDSVRSDGRGVIMLVPEIALTPQAVSIFRSYYGDSVAVLHSRLSNGERYDAWRRIRDGFADVVIGTRSAVFAPVKDLGLIVIDEEQEHTYKSESDPKYSAHDVARFRCAENGALMLLASATPSFESYYKAVSGKYSLIKLKTRYGGATLPKVELCDMRSERAVGNVSSLSEPLVSRLSETVENGEQAIVFLNRRGYNHTVSCMACGEAVMCPNCSVSMTYHVKGKGSSEQYGVLMCHYCGTTLRIPEKCPSCGKEHFRHTGSGTQRVEEEIQKLIPGARIARMDADTTSGKGSYGEILEGFRRGDTNILLGTQMVTKGHDFPKVTLVGVLDADLSIHMDDYRATERTFSMLTQVVGRAGRKGGEEGVALIQTLNPYNDVIRDAVSQNYEAFFEREIKLRREVVFPPFCDIAVITVSSQDESLLAIAASGLDKLIRKLALEKYSDVALQAFGPFETPVYKVRNMFRMRMVLKCRLNKRTREMLSEVMTETGKNSKRQVTVGIDLNPEEV